MTTYAVKVDKTHPYFDDPEAVQYLAEHEDPGVPYRRFKGFPAFRNASLVRRTDGGDWEHVNGLDLQCIAMRAKHEIMKKRALIDGYGWARCTCGWQDENSYENGMASHDFEAAAARHIADVDARVMCFRELLGYVGQTPEQAACPHANDDSRVHQLDPTKKEWHCRDCGLYVKYDLEIAS